MVLLIMVGRGRAWPPVARGDRADSWPGMAGRGLSRPKRVLLLRDLASGPPVVAIWYCFVREAIPYAPGRDYGPARGRNRVNLAKGNTQMRTSKTRPESQDSRVVTWARGWWLAVAVVVKRQFVKDA